MEKMSLLEALQKRLELEYLSDLRFLKDRKEVLDVLEEIPSGRYSLAAWKDAGYYLTGCGTSFDTAERVRSSILEELQKNRK